MTTTIQQRSGASSWQSFYYDFVGNPAAIKQRPICSSDYVQALAVTKDILRGSTLSHSPKSAPNPTDSHHFKKLGNLICVGFGTNVWIMHYKQPKLLCNFAIMNYH
jgi:hypothetical protein